MVCGSVKISIAHENNLIFINNLRSITYCEINFNNYVRCNYFSHSVFCNLHMVNNGTIYIRNH